MDMGRGEKGAGWMHGESNMETYITICKVDSQWEFAVWLRELNPGLCNDKTRGGMGADTGRRFEREGTYVYLWLIHVDVWQKPTKFCKAIILQLIKNLKLRKETPFKYNTNKYINSLK